MPERIHVRAKDTGHEFPIWSYLYDPEVHEETGLPALGPDGEPVATKHKTTVAKSAAAKQSQSGQKAESKKENS